MENLILLIKIIAVAIASSVLGSWFLTEVKKSKQKGEPAYKPYLSPPGIIISLLMLFLPIFAWVINR